jgi:Fur family iron response transcriptional regulator
MTSGEHQHVDYPNGSAEQGSPDVPARVAGRLAELGHQVTTQRLKLAELIFSKPQHLAAEDLLRMALAAGIKVSKATVYNTLNLFAECGLVREVNVDADRLYYDSTTIPHHHFFNEDTGELSDVPMNSVCLGDLPEPPEGTETAGVEVVIRLRNRR